MMSTSIQFGDLGYCFQGHIRPAKRTQNGTLDSEVIHLLYYYLLSLQQKKNIIASLLKFAGYIHNHKILPGNIFGLILKNKTATRDVYSI